MPEQVWRCKTCLNICYSEEEAAKCEGVHPDISKLKLDSVQYAPKKPWGWGTNSPSIPDKVLVRFGEGGHEYAVYALERVGPKGA